VPPLAVLIDQIFDDRTRFGDGQAVIGNHRRLAERMHRAQLGRRQHRFRIALVTLDLVRHAEFFEQPQHALRAGVVQMMDGEHGSMEVGEKGR
jgi:uncharacterized sporulation protein YeaH/YhbH (DUF444 family)